MRHIPGEIFPMVKNGLTGKQAVNYLWMSELSLAYRFFLIISSVLVILQVNSRMLQYFVLVYVCVRVSE